VYLEKNCCSLPRFSAVSFQQCACDVIRCTVLWCAVVCFRLLACRSYQMWLPLWGFWEARTGQYAVTGGPYSARLCKRRRTLEAAVAARATAPVRAKVGTGDIQVWSPSSSMNKTNRNNETALITPTPHTEMHTVSIKECWYLRFKYLSSMMGGLKGGDH
jgi:hypothetical protein